MIMYVNDGVQIAYSAACAASETVECVSREVSNGHSIQNLFAFAMRVAHYQHF